MNKGRILIPLYTEKSFEKKIDIELAEIKVYGKNIISEECNVTLKMSKDALVGFATYAIRIASTSEILDRLCWQVDPLGNPSGNQPLGFFLTSDSPSFVLMYNQAEQMSIKSEIKYKEIDEKCKFKFNYEVPLEVSDNIYEPFEINFQNVAAISIHDKNGIDVTDKCVSIIFKINMHGLFEFGISLLKLAHNYIYGNQYLVGHVNGNENMYNFGITLTEISSNLRIQCENCGNVFKYEPHFGA